MRTRRLYRAVAYYPLRTGGEYAVTRHFQTKRARDEWANRRRQGYDEDPFLGGDPDQGLRPGIPPAVRIEVADSEPIVFGEATVLS